MFYYLNGKITIMDANLAVVECGGVGYACYTTSYTQGALQLGQDAKLYTYCYIREDAFTIYGFATREELRLFEQLLGVSGVGPKAALAILSANTPDSVTLAIMTGDEKAISRAQGVGKKLAQRVILELKDKMGSNISLDFTQGTKASAAVPAPDSALALAMAALSELGYNQTEIGKALKGIDPAGMTTEQIIRHGLQAMVMG